MQRRWTQTAIVAAVRLLTGWALCGFAPMAAADARAVLLPQDADPYPGHEYRDAVDQASRYHAQGRPEAAWNVLQPAIVHCDDKRSDARIVYYSVAEASEEAALRAAAPPGARVEFIDRACPMAYKMAAFLAVDTRENERALALLDRAQALAPHWPEPMAERAYLLGQSGKPAAALALYRQALELVARHPRSAYLKGLVLRGIGYQLIELGDLDGAERAYRDSLQADPDSDLARRELEFIRVERARAGGG